MRLDSTYSEAKRRVSLVFVAWSKIFVVARVLIAVSDSVLEIDNDELDCCV